MSVFSTSAAADATNSTGVSGIAGHAERTRRIRLSAPIHEHAQRAESVEDPAGEDDVGEELLERPGGREHRGPDRDRDDRERRRAERGVHDREPLEEHAVARHGEIHSRRREHDPVGRAEDRDQDQQPDDAAGDRAEHRDPRVRRDAIARGDSVWTERGEIAEVREHVEHHERRGGDRDPARERALRIARLSGREGDVLPSFVRPEHTDHGGADAREQPAGDRRGPCASAHDRAHRRIRSEHDHPDAQREQSEHLRSGGPVLHRRAVARAAHVDRCDRHDHADGDEPRANASDGHELREVAGERDGERRDRAARDHEEARPSIEEGRQRAERIADVRVQTARIRLHRAHLRVRERAEIGEHARSDPHEQRGTGLRPRLAQHDTGHEEDSRADHRSDGDEREIEKAERAAQFRHGCDGASGCLAREWRGHAALSRGCSSST